jgi:hypothetical protein
MNSISHHALSVGIVNKGMMEWQKHVVAVVSWVKKNIITNMNERKIIILFLFSFVHRDSSLPLPATCLLAAHSRVLASNL